MATITLNVPDDVAIRVRDALCAYIGLNDPADQTLANAKRGAAQAIRNIVRDYERNNATRTAIDALPAEPGVE